MRSFSAFLAACLLFRSSSSTPIVGNNNGPDLQVLLEEVAGQETRQLPAANRRLNGRFLHITDIHPDKHYKLHSSTEEDVACHRGKGSAGIYGAETSDCDTPLALVNETFKWIAENLKDKIDFVVWTGDSARHDSDEEIPRTQSEVLSTNRWIVEKFVEVFGSSEDSNKALEIPIISTFGNNDILPHNILLSGPNKWLKEYTSIWNRFIPEEQRHGFERGGWYYVEVIPSKLAVFSLNTLYFFNNNAAVDGCALRSEPGFEHMEWLRIQLQFMRERGMKAILTGHVPPARTESKQLWDETCWQKYTLWLERYRDVVVGGLYGHMNIDHFMLQDTKEVDLLQLQGHVLHDNAVRETLDDDLSIQSASDYLVELRENWSSLPNTKLTTDPDAGGNDGEEDAGNADRKKKKKKGKKGKKKKDPFKKLGGRWGERFQVSFVAPSVVPNYFPTLRVIEYNITGLEQHSVGADPSTASNTDEQIDWMEETSRPETEVNDTNLDSSDNIEEASATSGKKKKGSKKHKKKPKKPTNPDLIIPSPPTKGTPPGPAYSPQTLSLLSYTQYFANLTHINNEKYVQLREDLPSSASNNPDSNTIGAEKWRQGKHKGKHAHDRIPHPKKFNFEVEYDTKTDGVYGLSDLTVRSCIELARRIGKYRAEATAEFEGTFPEGDDDGEEEEEEISEAMMKGGAKKKKKGKGKHGKHGKQHEKNKVWLAFVKRAFVGTVEEEDLRSLEQPVELLCVPEEKEESEEILMGDDGEVEGEVDLHDGEL